MPPDIRLISIVEALTVTGPVKPLLMFSPLARTGLPGCARVLQTLMTTRRSRNQSDRLQPAAEAAGLDYQVIYEKGPFDLTVLSAMSREICRRSPQIIETHDCKSHFLVFLLKIFYLKIRRTPWVAFHHGYTQTSWKVSLYQQLDRLSLRVADRVMTLCKPFASMLESRGISGKKIHIISNAIQSSTPPAAKDVEDFRHHLGICEDECVIVTVGRLSVEKAQDDLIRAFMELTARDDNIRARLVIVGDGPERDRLKGMAKRSGSKILFLGHMQDPSIVFFAADIFALTSMSEGSPLVILEAMAASLAIVATSVGGVPELIADEETALLTKRGDVASLTDALRRLCADPQLRSKLGSAAEEALKNFSPEAYSRRLIGIYEDVTKPSA